MKNTKDLVQFLQNEIDKKVQKIVNSKIIEMLELKNKDVENYETNLLKMAYFETDYFNLVVMNTAFELLYHYRLIKEDFSCNKNIPNGSNYNYGNYFEAKLKEFLLEIEGVEIYKKGTTDGIIRYNNIDYVLEIKCSKTNTIKQINRYLSECNIDNFITVNGHTNSIDFTFMFLVRCTEQTLKDTFKLAKELNSIK
jgi:hypothetical protein